MDKNTRNIFSPIFKEKFIFFIKDYCYRLLVPGQKKKAEKILRLSSLSQIPMKDGVYRLVN